MALVLDGDNGIVGVLATNTDGDVIFDTNTLFVDAVENKVGIGTNSPTNKLHVNSGTDNTAALFQSTDTEVVLEFTDSAGTAYLKASGDYIKMGVTPSDSLTILYGGNVGIGAANPVEKLQVDGSFKVGNLKIQDSNGGRIGFNRNTANGDVYDSNFAAFQINGAYAGADFMAFEAYNSGGVGTTAMVIRDNGNVGIGTTNPDDYYAKDLVVNAADEGGITIVNGTSQQGYLMFADGTSGAQTYRGYIGYDHAIDHLQITSGGIVKFLVNNNQEKMSITTSGVIQGASDAEIATSPIRTHSNTISTNTTIDANDNAVASGPLGIADGVTLTINGNMTVV